MPRESLASQRERAQKIEERMFELYGEGACSLDYLTPFQLTVAVVLSALLPRQGEEPRRLRADAAR